MSNHLILSYKLCIGLQWYAQAYTDNVQGYTIFIDIPYTNNVQAYTMVNIRLV